jgi:putative transposase
MNHFKGKQFQQDVIIVAVGYYLRYNLSYREVQEILYDRDINVSHTTIYRWVQEYGKLLYQIWKKKNKKSFYSWKMDETYIKKLKENGIIFVSSHRCRWFNLGYLVT